MSTYLRVSLATSRSSVRQARDVVRVWLADVGRSSVEYVAAQIVDELTANAVQHAHGPILLHLWCRPNGRGLNLVARLASEWGTDVHERGKIIWADVVVAVPAVAAASSRREGARAAQWHLGWQGARSRDAH